MRGEHRLDAHRCDQRQRLLERQPSRLQARDAFRDAAGLRVLESFEILAAPAHAVHLLGGIDRLEPDGEGARQVGGGRRRAARGARLRARPSLPGALAPRDGGEPVAFDQLEELLAALSRSISPMRAPSACTSSRSPASLSGKLDAFAVHDWRRSICKALSERPPPPHSNGNSAAPSCRSSRSWSARADRRSA